MEKATNGQFRELIGKLLVRGNDENVSKIDKTKIQEVINFLSDPKDEKVFENFINFINNGFNFIIGSVVKEFSSKLFQKTTTLQIKKCKGFEITEENIRSFLGPIYKRETERGNSVSIDNDLWRYFLGEKVLGISKNFTSTIYRFLTKLTHQQILDEAERTGIKKVHSFMEGLSIILKAVLADEVDKKGTGIFVYFKMKEDGPLYRFLAYRRDDSKLNLDVCKVLLDLEWSSGGGASFRN